MFDVSQYTADSDPTMAIIKKSIFIGLCTVVTGHISAKIAGPYFKVDLPEACKQWNAKNLMEVMLFMTGFLLYALLTYFKIKY